MKRTPNKSQHTKLALAKKILPPLLPGFELATFRSRVRRSYQQVIPVWDLIKFDSWRFIVFCTFRSNTTEQKIHHPWFFITSAHVEASWVKIRLADLEIFRGKRCGLHLAKYFWDSRAFCVLLTKPATVRVSANPKWVSSSKIALSLSDEGKFVFIEIPQSRLIYAFGAPPWKTSRTGTGHTRAISLLPVKWATVWQVNLFLNRPPNVSSLGTWRSKEEVI